MQIHTYIVVKLLYLFELKSLHIIENLMKMEMFISCASQHFPSIV